MKKRIVIANFFPSWPVVIGGQRRVFYLARELAKQFKVEIIVPTRVGRTESVTFNPNLREIRVAVERRFLELENKLCAKVEMASDVAYSMHWDECILYNKCLSKSLTKSNACITAHPYSIYALLQARGDANIPIIYDAHNVEIQQKASVLEDFPNLLKTVRDAEETALSAAQHVIACSSDDAIMFTNEYHVQPTKITVVENGVDALGVPHVPEDTLNEMRSRLGLKDQLVAVFAGAFHHPNLLAAKYVLEFAKLIPEMKFILLGGLCKYAPLRESKMKNVICLDDVDETTKWMAFRIADIGLNPMTIGSGSNIKMFEYAAAELAVVSSPFGARGVRLREESEIIIRPLDMIGNTLRALSIEDRARLAEIGVAARKNIVENSDWSVLGGKYNACLSSLV